jgi:hypothetical protein
LVSFFLSLQERRVKSRKYIEVILAARINDEGDWVSDAPEPNPCSTETVSLHKDYLVKVSKRALGSF